MEEPRIGALRQIIVPVDDVGGAVDYYSQIFGIDVTFQDADRWAVLRLPELTLALAGPAERTARRGTVLSVKVLHLDDALARIRSEGGRALGDPSRGAHERRVDVADRFGNSFVVYESLTS